MTKSALFAPLALILAAALPAAAFAHPGDHSAMSAEAGLRHLLSAPDHLFEIALLTTLIAGAGFGWRRIARLARR